MTLLFSMLDYIGVGKTAVPAWSGYPPPRGPSSHRTMHEFVDKITSLGQKRKIGGFKMQELIKPRKKSFWPTELWARVLGWKAGDLPYNPEPAYFEKEEDFADFVYNGFWRGQT